MKNLIDLMIIGAQKAGSTSLKNYLGEHPQIVTHFQTECEYFQAGAENKGMRFEDSFNKSFNLSKLKNDSKIIAKNVRTHFREDDFLKLQQHNSKMELVFILRNPVDRAYSSYLMARKNGWIKKDFGEIKHEIMLQEGKMYNFFIKVGLYHEQLEKIYKIFNYDKINIFLFKDLKQNPQKICNTIFEKLGVSTNFFPNTNQIHNKTNTVYSSYLNKFINGLKREDNPIKKMAKNVLPYKYFTKIAYSVDSINKSSKLPSKMDDEIRNYLINFYRPYNERIQSLINLDLSHWNY